MTPRTVRILVPPGIGDGYWVFVKLRDFLKVHGIRMPEVYVHDAAPSGRSAGFWQRVPFVQFAGSANLPKKWRQCAKLAYRPPGVAVQRNVGGFDYFLSFNGSLEGGSSLDRAMPRIATSWFEPIDRPDTIDALTAGYRARFGRYVACAFWDHGFYRHWLTEFPEEQVVASLRLLADSGMTPVLMGASWDKDGLGSRLANADPRFVDFVGHTDFDQLTALLEGSAGVFGFPAGNSILGPYFHRPTVLLWHAHFDKRMWVNVCPPESQYKALPTLGATAESAAEALLTLMEVEVA